MTPEHLERASEIALVAFLKCRDGDPHWASQARDEIAQALAERDDDATSTNLKQISRLEQENERLKAALKKAIEIKYAECERDHGNWRVAQHSQIVKVLLDALDDTGGTGAKKT